MDLRLVLVESKVQGDSRVGWVVSQEISRRVSRAFEWDKYVYGRNV
jgi:hypothetical protein